MSLLFIGALLTAAPQAAPAEAVVETTAPAATAPAATAPAATLPAATAPAATPEESDEIPSAPITNALRTVDPEILVYNDHLTFLSSPYLRGRLPGTPGMELAKDYVEHYFAEAGLQPAFVDESGAPSFRQPFDLGGELELRSESMSIGDTELVAGTDFTSLSLGSGGDVSLPLVFVGYSIARGPDGYRGYADEDDLTGKIAVMFRFEPMDENGNSLWVDNRPWSARAGFNRKVRDAAERGAGGIIIINPPGADDPRALELSEFSMGGSMAEIPVVMLTAEAGERLIAPLDPEGRSLLELRQLADADRIVQPLNGEAHINADLELVTVTAENVAGIVPGRGELANEVIVVGAHLDHLGMGEFGSRDRQGAGKQIHPGADDNASGSAAMILIGERLVADYAALPEGAPARTIVIICFSAEESGLNGAAHYADNPILPIEDHVMMLNFDMIGRIEDGRLSVSGTGTGAGLAEWAEPFFERCPLTVVPQEEVMPASDHFRFYQAGVPVLFAICDTFHADYHTPRDTVDKINRVGAVDSARLWHELTLSAALRPERFEFVKAGAGASPGRRSARSAESAPVAAAVTEGEPAEEVEVTEELPAVAVVTLGAAPGNYNDSEPGVLVGSVGADSPAAAAGVQAGDRLMTWNGDELTDAGVLMELLRASAPGDVVTLGVLRPTEGGDPEAIELSATLQEKQGTNPR